MKKTNRIFELDFIRTLACIMIVIFHFRIGEKSIYPENILLKNFSLGTLGVALFIILSGVSLYLSDKNVTYFEFVKKRIKSIYPLIYLCTFLFAIVYFFINPHLFDAVPTYRIIYTILGIDGLLLYKFATFNIVGEWYIGCIMIIYLIYPILKKCIDKKPKLTLITLMIIYLLSIRYYNLGLLMDRFPLIRLLDFSLGIYFARIIINKNHSDKRKLIAFILCLIVMIYTLFIKNNIFVIYNITLGGLSLFYVLYYLASFIKNDVVKRIINLISKKSYIIFLVHHQISNLLSFKFGGEILYRSRFYFIFIIYIFLIIVTVMIVEKIYKRIIDFKTELINK